MIEASEPSSPDVSHSGSTEAHDSPRSHPDRASRPRLDAAVLAEIVRRVVEVAQPDRIILFGSAARGESGPDSDIDLLVIKSGVEHRRRLAEAIYMNLSGVGAAVDVVVATPEDVERFGSRIGSVIRPALREGEEIYVA
jgi:predicted nucleotidyltransferase